MTRRGWWWCLVLACGAATASEPRFVVSTPVEGDAAAIAKSVAAVSEQVLDAQQAGRVKVPTAGLAQLRIAAGQASSAVGVIQSIMHDELARDGQARARRWLPYLLYAQAQDGSDFEQAYGQAFRDWFDGLDDLEALQAQYWFSGDLSRAEADLARAVSNLDGAGDISLEDALGLARVQAFAVVLAGSTRHAADLIATDEAVRYFVDDQVLIRTPDGATLSAVVARSRKLEAPAPAAMVFTIYADAVGNRMTALRAAARGYVGVVVDARGKRLGSGAIVPYEHEADDATAAIDWISRQPWSDGRVAMYGGSYSGFAAWAASKRAHPALRTIVPYAAAIPGMGVPMENNVFLLANYAWPFYVGNGRLPDNDTYFQRQRWDRLAETWYASGRAFREIDQVDGTPNPLLQRWLTRPAYDRYWQAMAPYGEEFARIDIPMLTITGYYDDSQVSALHWYREHLRHRPQARHYLLIGPYDHFGVQGTRKPHEVNGYAIDPVAQFDTEALTFAWLDHVLRGGALPALLRDRVNYQLMGANAWGHAASLQAAAEPVAFHLSAAACGPWRCLSRAAGEGAPLRQVVDFADRTRSGHSYYPYPALRARLELDSGFAFASEPFAQPTSVVGAFSGALKLRISKRDFDFSVSLYEQMADGRVLQLSYYVGRASHARDMSRRELLEPGEWTMLPFERTRMTARRMEAGSRLLVVVDVLKDAHHQLNMGTGGDVSDESIADASEPLTVEWHPDSLVRVPLREDAPP